MQTTWKRNEDEEAEDKDDGMMMRRRNRFKTMAEDGKAIRDREFLSNGCCHDEDSYNNGQ